MAALVKKTHAVYTNNRPTTNHFTAQLIKIKKLG